MVNEIGAENKTYLRNRHYCIIYECEYFACVGRQRPAVTLSRARNEITIGIIIFVCDSRRRVSVLIDSYSWRDRNFWWFRAGVASSHKTLVGGP